MNEISNRITNLSPAKLTLLKLLLKNKNTSSVGNTSPTLVNNKPSSFDLSVAHVQFQTWTSEFQTNKLIRISKHLVHKDEERNVLLARLEQIKDDIIIGEVVQDLSHSFFYEHSKDHVPGLYILEATRQFVTALSHLYYNIPLGKAFIMNELQARFYRFAETSIPLFLVTRIIDKIQVNDKILQMHCDTFIVQNEEVIAEVSGIFNLFDLTIYNNLRSKALTAKAF